MFEIDTPGEIFLRLFGVESHRNIHSCDVGRLEENVDTRRKRSWQTRRFYYKTGAKLFLFFLSFSVYSDSERLDFDGVATNEQDLYTIFCPLSVN